MQNEYYPPLEVKQKIKVQCRYFAGKIGTKFFKALRDEKKIYGIRNKDGYVYCPPRQTCQMTFTQMTENDMVEIGPGGTVETFTIVNYREAFMPERDPLIMAVIKLDGASTGLTHLLGGMKPGEIEIGMRVMPVFADERKGNILDIQYFQKA